MDPFLTIAITLVQAPELPRLLRGLRARCSCQPTAFWWFSAVLILTSSTLLIMYLGERITERGVGNGISLLIMIGIIATFPQAIIQEFNHPDTNLYFFLVEIAALLVVIGLSVALVQAVRKVPVEMTRLQGNSGPTYLPQGCSCPQLHPAEGQFLGCDAHHLRPGDHVRSALPDAEREPGRQRGAHRPRGLQRFLVQPAVLPDDRGLHVLLHGHHGQPAANGG